MMVALRSKPALSLPVKQTAQIFSLLKTSFPSFDRFLLLDNYFTFSQACKDMALRVLCPSP